MPRRQCASVTLYLNVVLKVVSMGALKKVGLGHAPDRFARRLVRSADVLVLCAALMGCGAETYERRLEETRKYFEYLQNVNQALSPAPWSEMGIELRVPKQFEMIPPPTGATDPDGLPQPASPASDPRQPRFLEVELPGLLGAWRATVPVDTDRETRDLPAFLYVCSNHFLWLQREKNPDVDPLSFDVEFGRRLAPVVGVSPPSSDYDWEWTEEKIPKPGSYAPSKLFDTITFEVVTKGVKYDLMLFRHHAQDIHVILMYLVPEDIAPQVRLRRAIEYSLHSLKVSPEVPTSQPAAKPARRGF
ncbi:MAG TPA: hypothetical protein EYP14_18495 [Planctomycetaceae bacterium]|nr:hypothetical protein [Planctomycetaceae bacterium]